MDEGTLLHASSHFQNKNSGPTDQGGSLVTVRRFDSSTIRVVCSANLVCAYRYSSEDKKWDKLNIEGPLFLYERDAQPPFALFILNKNSLRNWGCILDETSELQERDRYLLIQVRSNAQPQSVLTGGTNTAAKGIHMICFRSVAKCQEFCDIIRENAKLKVLVVKKNDKFNGLERDDGAGELSDGDVLTNKFNTSGLSTHSIMDAPLQNNNKNSNNVVPNVNSISRSNNTIGAWLSSSQQQQFSVPADSSSTFTVPSNSAPVNPVSNAAALHSFLTKASAVSNLSGVHHSPQQQQQLQMSKLSELPVVSNNPAFKYHQSTGGPGTATPFGFTNLLQQQLRQHQVAEQQQPGTQPLGDGALIQQALQERDAERDRMFAKLDHNLSAARTKKTVGTGISKQQGSSMGSAADLINLTHGLEIADKASANRAKSSASNLQQQLREQPTMSIEQILSNAGISEANLKQILQDAGLTVNTGVGSGDSNGIGSRATFGSHAYQETYGGGLRYDSDNYSPTSSAGLSARPTATITGRTHKHQRTDSDTTIGSSHTARGEGGDSRQFVSNHNQSVGIDPRSIGLGLTEAQFGAAFRFMLQHDEPFVKDLLFNTFKPVMGEPEFIGKLHQSYSAALAEQFSAVKK